MVEVDLVEVRDLELATRGGLERLGVLDDLFVIDVQAGGHVVGTGLLGLLLDVGDLLGGGVEVDDGIGLGVLHLIAKHRGALLARDGLGEVLVKAGAVEDTVSEDERHAVAVDEVLANEKRLGDAIAALLGLVLDVHAKLGAIAKVSLVGAHILRVHDEQNVADIRLHERGERVVDERLVIDGKQVLGARERHGVQVRAETSGQNDALHLDEPPWVACMLVRSIAPQASLACSRRGNRAAYTYAVYVPEQGGLLHVR